MCIASEDKDMDSFGAIIRFSTDSNKGGVELDIILVTHDFSFSTQVGKEARKHWDVNAPPLLCVLVTAMATNHM